MGPWKSSKHGEPVAAAPNPTLHRVIRAILGGGACCVSFQNVSRKAPNGSLVVVRAQRRFWPA